MSQPKKSGTKKGKTTTGTGRGKNKAPVPAQPAGSSRAFYILVIIILITVIVLLVNRYADRGMFKFPVIKTDKVTSDKKKDIKEKDAGTSSGEVDRNNVKPPEQHVKQDTAGGTAVQVQEKDITIYLLKLDEKTEKIYLSQVRRKVRGEKLLESAIESLIKGPTADEENRGYITAVPETLRLRGVSVKGRTAEIDFSGAIEESAAGDIVIKRVQQIVYTATQFENIDSIIILINGTRRKTLGSDGFSISGPLRR